MVTMEQAKKGLRQYIEHEIAEKVPGLKKWMVMVSIDPLVSEMERMFTNNKAILVRTGYMDEECRINDDRIFDELLDIARKTGAVIDNMPFIGDVSFSDSDIRMLHKYVG